MQSFVPQTKRQNPQPKARNFRKLEYGQWLAEGIGLGVDLLWFQPNPLPTDWVAQREVVAGFDA